MNWPTSLNGRRSSSRVRTIGAGSASGEVDGEKASAEVIGYVSFADDPLYAIIEVALGVVVLYFAFRTKAPAE